MMKLVKIILTLFCSCLIFEGYTQHYIGVSGGTGSGSIRMFPFTETGSISGLYSGGITYKYYGGMKYVGGIGSDLLFMQQGYAEEIPYQSDTTRTLSRKVNSVILPIFWQPHVNLFKGKARFFVNLGVTFSYNISSTIVVESEQNGLIAEGDYEMILVRDNRWGYGLCGGAGLSVTAGRFDVGIEGRYYFGYSDVLRNRTKYETNPLRSAMDNINISMSVSYRLGGGKDKTKNVKIKEIKENGDNKAIKGI